MEIAKIVLTQLVEYDIRDLMLVLKNCSVFTFFEKAENSTKFWLDKIKKQFYNSYKLKFIRLHVIYTYYTRIQNMMN